jgi:predicted nucleic-acid-binding Zn-ribbon protein
MGTKCPECGEHAAYISAITATGEQAKKPEDIIARKLSCGHIVGNTDYNEYRKQLAAIEEDEANKIRAIKTQGIKSRQAIWIAITAPKKEE